MCILEARVNGIGFIFWGHNRFFFRKIQLLNKQGQPTKIVLIESVNENSSGIYENARFTTKPRTALSD